MSNLTTREEVFLCIIAVLLGTVGFLSIWIFRLHWQLKFFMDSLYRSLGGKD